MNRLPSLLRTLAALALGSVCAFGAAADEVKVLAAGAFRPVVAAMAPGFAQRTGHKVLVVDGAEGALAERIRAGEDFDLAVLPQALLEALGREGAVSDGSIVPLARGAAATVYAGAVSTDAANSQAALSLLILLASEETQTVLKRSGLTAP
ncbi:MAG TPA: substrate-binding domain-containing protein [Ramlibacter sp.]|uniref:substrate-binding domain-containing protein n=1 Tax=Ramlibacter sp. TaxID=1917967 RepID=UPI002D808A78|nr:substrate-binding domain-containing protein [Ramlibacter sp.]HET8748010.1 substrate-binding domain-containing protein [Ramlibacter sp.]